MPRPPKQTNLGETGSGFGLLLFGAFTQRHGDNASPNPFRALTNIHNTKN